MMTVVILTGVAIAVCLVGIGRSLDTIATKLNEIAKNMKKGGAE